MEFDADTRADLGKLKFALEKVTGRAEDPLAAARAFVSRDQAPHERVEDFAADLRKIFKQAYPGEALTSSVLHQRFLTGLRPSISRQLLLRKMPTKLSEAIEGAVEVPLHAPLHGLWWSTPPSTLPSRRAKGVRSPKISRQLPSPNGPPSDATPGHAVLRWPIQLTSGDSGKDWGHAPPIYMYIVDYFST